MGEQTRSDGSSTAKCSSTSAHIGASWVSLTSSCPT